MSVTASMYFLANLPLYEDEKPYRLKYDPPAGLPESNIEMEQHSIFVQDVRKHERDFTLQKDGFALLSLKSAMTYEDFNDDIKIKTIYLKELAGVLRSTLDASRVQIFEHLIRKQHANFPLAPAESWSYKLPTTVAHVDMTRSWAATMARRLNHKIGLGNIPSQKYQYINIWKPLRGPVRDWPLALCDPKSLVPESMQDGDVVFEDFVIENKLLQYDAGYKWFYASDQGPDEVWAFVQADFKCVDGRLSGVPHASFLHANSVENTSPRESIEVRAIVFFDDAE